MKILILGGTGEARDLANRLVDLGHQVITALAGRTSDPILPRGELRQGQFGGIAGLVAYLRAARIDRLVDATHPYAEMMSRNAVAAGKATGTPLVRYLRPAWERPEGGNWITVTTSAEAAAGLPPHAAVLLTTGHAGLEKFLQRDDCRFVVRLIEPPALALPDHARLLLSRPPQSLPDELALLERERISHLVSKNSGGEKTFNKLIAARQMGVQVIMIARPIYDPTVEVASLDDAVRAIVAGSS